MDSTNWSLLALFVTLVVVVAKCLGGSRATPLRSPPRGHPLFGQSNILRLAQDRAPIILDEWSERHGNVFQQPGPLGKDFTMLMDPKAVAHFYANGETTYESTGAARRAIGNLVGHGILTAEGDDHKRQRRAMTAGFTNAKMKEYTALFIDSAYKIKSTWDQKFENAKSVEINITPWMNAVSLDSLGSAAFSHEFGASSGLHSGVGDAFTAFVEQKITLSSLLVFLVQPVLPFVASLPTPSRRAATRVKEECGTLAKKLLQDSKEAEAQGNKAEEKSVLGLLLKSQSAQTGFPMNEEEVNGIMRTLMLAGFATTSISMTWGLIELVRNPDLQEKMRAEIMQKFSSNDPTWEELTQELPLLDAFVHETLRLHPSVIQTARKAATDDIIPLSQPLTLPNGTATDKIHVKAGTTVIAPIAALNIKRSFWGDDAYEFKPERWLNGGEGIPAAAKELQGHRHLMTFINGPRTCLGKAFALAEFKSVFAVLIKHYSFEFAGGPNTKVERSNTLTARPTVEGSPLGHIPMLVTRVE